MSTRAAPTQIPIDPVSYETLDWKPRTPDLYSRAELQRQTGPYDAAT